MSKLNVPVSGKISRGTTAYGTGPAIVVAVAQILVRAKSNTSLHIERDSSWINTADKIDIEGLGNVGELHSDAFFYFYNFHKYQGSERYSVLLVGWLTLSRNGLIFFDTTEQSGAVENLVKDDREAVDVSLLCARRQADHSRSL